MKKQDLQTKAMIFIFLIMILASVAGHYILDNSIEDLKIRVALIFGAFIMLMNYYFTKS